MFFQRKLTPTDVENFRKEGNLRGLLRALQSKEAPAHLAAFQELSRIAPAPVKEVAALVTHRDKSIRYRAVRLLGEMEDPAAIPVVAQVLRDNENDPQMIMYATRALDILDWTPTHDLAGVLYFCRKKQWLRCVPCGAVAVEPLIAHLLALLMVDESDWEPANEKMAGEITRALAEIGEPSANAVVPLLFHPHEKVAAAAHTVVTKLGKTAVPPLLAQLQQQQQEAPCVLIADLLKKVGDEDTSAALIQKMLSAEPRCQVACCEALSAFGKSHTAREVIKAQQVVIASTVWNNADAAFDTRKAEVARRQLGYLERVLSAIGKPALDVILQHINTENALLLDQFMNAIERMGTVVYDPIIALLDSPQVLVRERVVRILKVLHWVPEDPQEKAEYHIAQRQWEPLLALGEDAVKPLIKSLYCDSYNIRARAADSLSQLQAVLVNTEDKVRWGVFSQQFDDLVALGRSAVKPLLHLLREAVDPESPYKTEELRTPVVKGIMHALREIGADAVVDLVMMLEGDAVYLRAYAINILVPIGEPAIPLLINTVRRHDNEQVRQMAAQALSQIKETPASFYRDCLINRLPQLKRIAARYFHENPDPAVLRFLLQLANETGESYPVRLSAIEALGSYTDSQVLPVLKEVLFSSNQPEVQTAALDALAERGVLVEDLDLIGFMVDQMTSSTGAMSVSARKALSSAGGVTAVNTLMDLLNQYDGQLSLLALQSGPPGEYQRIEQLRMIAVQVLIGMGVRVVEPMFRRCAMESMPWLDSFQQVFVALGQPVKDRLIPELVSPFFFRRRMAARLLERLEWVPETEELHAALLIAHERWEEVLPFGSHAVNPLLELLDADQEMYQRKAAQLLDGVGWSPSSDQVGCRYWIARGQYQNCTLAGEMAVVPLLQALEKTVIQIDARESQTPQVDTAALKLRRKQIKEALLGIGPEAVALMTEHFRSPTTIELLRPHISHVLAYADGPHGEHLLPLLMNRDELMIVRQQSAYALGLMGCTRAITPLLMIIPKEQIHQGLVKDCLEGLLGITRHTDNQAHLHEIRLKIKEYLGTGVIKAEGLRQLGIRILHICDHKLSPSSDASPRQS
jgi:HEAT repeat protein